MSDQAFFAVRIAIRATDTDETRVMLQPLYGEVDPEWKPNK